MAFDFKWFGEGAYGLLSATAARRVDWVGDTLKVMLCTSTFVPNQDTHNFKDDVTNEITGTGYTAGGVTLGTKTLTYDTGSNTVRADAADSVWSTATFTARIAVLYKDTGVAGTSPVLGYGDFGSDISVTAANFTITWDATDGVLKMVVS